MSSQDGRFRGTEITGEIVDNRQEHMNAFGMVREGMAFLERTMPLGARFPEGKIFRRTASRSRWMPSAKSSSTPSCTGLLHYSGYVAIVVFDDRIEIRSYGRLPTGITVDQLRGDTIRNRPTVDRRCVPPNRRGGGLGARHQPGDRAVQEARAPPRCSRSGRTS